MKQEKQNEVSGSTVSKPRGNGYNIQGQIMEELKAEQKRKEMSDSRTKVQEMVEEGLIPVVEVEIKDETIRVPKISPSYTIRAFGENIKKLKQLKLVEGEDLEKLKELHEKVIMNWIKK